MLLANSSLLGSGVFFRVPATEFAFEIGESLRECHEPISDYFHSDRGIRLQRKDSDLAHRIMTETGAIGIHDGFVIEASREEELRNAMKRAFAEEYDGYEVGVSRELEPLTESTGKGRDFAPDRPASAESGADKQRRASPTPV